MSFVDKIKAKAEELDLPHKAEKLAQEANKAAHQAAEKAGELAHQNKDKVTELLDKAGKVVDDKTQGKYSDTVAKAKEQVTKGVDKLAEKRPGAAGAPAADQPEEPFGNAETFATSEQIADLPDAPDAPAAPDTPAEGRPQG